MSRIVVLLVTAASLTLVVTLALSNAFDGADHGYVEPLLRAAEPAYTAPTFDGTPVPADLSNSSNLVGPAQPPAQSTTGKREEAAEKASITDESGYESDSVTLPLEGAARRTPSAPQAPFEEAPDVDRPRTPVSFAHASFVPDERPVAAPGDVTEIRPWLVALTPGEDRPSAPTPAEAAPETVVEDKPTTDIEVALVVDAGGLDGVTVRVNGRRVGTAPAEVTLRLPSPGDLVVVFAKPGYAEETHQLRLGSDHPGGRVRVSADLREDRPSDVAHDVPRSASVEVDSDEPILDE